MGDPAFDIGYFIAQTKMSHGTLESLPEAQDVFLDEYKRCCSQIDEDFWRRVSIFEAQTYLQRIYHTYYLLSLKPDLDLISTWLSEAKNALRRAEGLYR